MIGKKGKILITSSLLISGYLLIYNFCDDLFRRPIYVHSLNKYNYYQTNQSKETPIKIILLWTDYFGMRWPDMSPLACDCDLTTDRRYLASASAVVYHLQDLDLNDVPDKRDAHSFVLLHMEPPYLTFSWRTPNLDAIDGINIDYYMTYRRDSDVYVPYGSINKRQTPSRHVLDETLFLSKRRDAAWFVSNCKSESKREEYVDDLMKYVNVDIYGKCGRYSCTKRLDADQNYCYQKVEKEYFFYLSFENSICIEYVTEKLFNILNYDVIPIVYGDAHEYEHIMPNNSYIDATKYDPKELASLMKNLASNYSLYSSYFDWKGTHFVDAHSWEEQFCKLCDKLHQDKHQLASDKHQSASDKKKKSFKKWWFEDAKCVEKKAKS